MLVGELLVALGVAFVLAFLLGYEFGSAGSWGSFLWFAVVVFIVITAAGFLFPGLGPQVAGVAWVPLVFGAILVALLLAGVSSRSPEEGLEPFDRVDDENRTVAALAVGVSFWMLLLGALVVVAVGILGF